MGGLYVDIVPKRDALARYGLTVSDLNGVIEQAIGGDPISVVIAGRNPLPVSWRTDPGWQSFAQVVPLRNLAPAE